MAVEVENLQKNSFIDPIAEAKGFKMLSKQALTEIDIGKEIGKAQQYVSEKLGLLRLEPKIQVQITSRLVSAEHGYEVSKIEDGKRRILAELSRRDRADSLSLKELREIAKPTFEELSKDVRVDKILLQDPAERMRRIEARVMNLENVQASVSDLEENLWSLTEDMPYLECRVFSLASNSDWKRDHCTHSNGDTCSYWVWKHQLDDREMKQGDNGWMLRVSKHPEICATCPFHEEKASESEAKAEGHSSSSHK